MRLDQIKSEIDAAAEVAGLGKHLYGWDGRELSIIFRNGSEKRSFRLPSNVSSSKIQDAKAAIKAAAASRPGT
jgi:hypothetical protein